MEQKLKYTCPKCGNKQSDEGEVWTVGSLLTRLFKIYNRRFTYVSCSNCHYTEFYKIQKERR